MKLTAMGMGSLAVLADVVHGLASLQKLQSLQQSKQALIQQLKLEALPMDQSMVLPKSVMYSTSMAPIQQLSQQTSGIDQTNMDEWDPDAQDFADTKKEEQQRQEIEHEILADYQNDIEISNSSRMFEDPIKMLEQNDNIKPLGANTTSTTNNSAHSLHQNKKHVLLAQLGALQHEQNKYSIEYLSEKEEEDQVKKDKYMKQMEDEDRRQLEEEKRKKEAESQAQESSKQLVKSSQNPNSFNAPKKPDDKASEDKAKQPEDKTKQIEDKSKPEDKKDQPDGKFISPTKFEKVNSGKSFFQNMIGAFKKLFS